MKSGPIGLTRCRLMLDGQVVVTSVTEQWEPGTTLSDVAYTAYHLPAGSVKKESARYVVSDSVGVGHASCGRLQKEGHEIFTMIREEHGTVGTAAMEKAITKFTEAVSSSRQCAGSTHASGDG
ncbi:hypothetical protein ACWCQS_43860 [Streptomyces sp. NPDC002076]